MTEFRNDGVNLPRRKKVNLHPGANVTITSADDEANDELDITIAANDSDNDTRIEALENDAILKPVRVVRSSNIDITNPGTDSIGGETLTAGDRVLLTAQTTGAEEGIYVFDTSATPMVRADDWAAGEVIPEGTVVYASEGTSAGITYRPSAAITVGTTNPTWSEVWVSHGIADAKGDLIVATAADTVARLAVGADGTVPVANAGDTAGIGYGWVDMSNVPATWRAAGSTAKAMSIPPHFATTNQATTDQQITFTGVNLPYDASLTGVFWFQNTNGNYTADNNNKVGLYSTDGTTMTLVASSADTAGMWSQGAGDWRSLAFSAPYAAQAGLYYVAMLYNNSAEVTNPTIARTGAFIQASAANPIGAPTQKMFGTLATQTDLPASQALAGITPSTASIVVGVY